MLRFLTVLILLMFVVVGGLAYLILNGPSTPVPTPTAVAVAPSGATAVPVATSVSPQQAAGSFDQKVSAFEKTASSGSKKSVELVLTQQEIGAKITQMLAAKGNGEFQNVAVQLQDGGAVISGNADVAGMSVPVQAGAQLSASGGMLGANVTSIKTGGLDLPPAVRDQLLQRVQHAAGLNDVQKIDVGIDVQSVQVTPTEVRIAGLTK